MPKWSVRSALADPRYLAWQALRAIQAGQPTETALAPYLDNGLKEPDRRLLMELVCGVTRQRGFLDAVIDQLVPRSPPVPVRLLLRLGLYQLHFCQQIPDFAAVDTTVALAEQVGCQRWRGLVNAVLRHYLRVVGDPPRHFPLPLPAEPAAALALQYSYPAELVQHWLAQLGHAETEQLCQWFNQPPVTYLRVNRLRTDVPTVVAQFQQAGLAAHPVPELPGGLQVTSGGKVTTWPGFADGHWTVQDAAAQWVSLILDPQPGETVIDACAAPGGKTTHIAELMRDHGTVWACELRPDRLVQLQANVQRLGLTCIRYRLGDARRFADWRNQADRVLVDAPCSGWGTLHRHPEARWRYRTEELARLVQLQRELLQAAATWVKPGGILVYATCTLNPAENVQQIQQFLAQHRTWEVVPPSLPASLASALDPQTHTVTFWPQRHRMDGFFIAKLRRR
ncbi:MAG: 16S rRNA (cytosine(967)-C(5))-methyltransferase RsmB [Gloeomargarita sp. SKYBB_i_bin120]|nr:16S rRNA (cytosine(967)-C(5))-methyltransferase RsmB [Gloeomargarita sp. SKYG98]MCS7292386.1 16S rRNA (cytosine(967)-C(5))-methyltransferase RsmB [Gloeomargarita sp. SKYB120]MDW8177946.1 16S rRNA (cytosine(967)-C(5))-methyltransferase RsmB [Gloeomargarita sp. SKYBB_i_bin120]